MQIKDMQSMAKIEAAIKEQGYMISSSASKSMPMGDELIFTIKFMRHPRYEESYQRCPIDKGQPLSETST